MEKLDKIASLKKSSNKPNILHGEMEIAGTKFKLIGVIKSKQQQKTGSGDLDLFIVLKNDEI